MLEEAETISGSSLEDTPKARKLCDSVRLFDQLLANGEADRALACIRSVLTECSDGTHLKLKLCRALLACGRHDELFKTCTDLQAKKDLSEQFKSEVEHMLAKALTHKGKIVEAITRFRELLRKDPDNAEYQSDCKKLKAMYAKLQEGDQLLSKTNFSQARSLYTEALDMDPTNDGFTATILSRRAETFHKQREEVSSCTESLNKAEKEVEQAQKELELAKMRLERAQQRLKDSRASNERVLKSFRQDECPTSDAPDPTSPYFEQTKSKDFVGKWAIFKAIDDSCNALDRDSFCVRALVCRARCYVLIEEFSEAILDYERALASPQVNENPLAVNSICIKEELRVAQQKQNSAKIDHYQALGLRQGGSNVTADDIKKAYRKLAIKYHPDKLGHLGGEARERMERKFKQITEANAILSNPTERRMYDIKNTSYSRSSGRYNDYAYFGSSYRPSHHNPYAGGGYPFNSSRSSFFNHDDDDEYDSM
uniref:J domain-containing protein n=1 Tax=Guillardia theta TaxID=55529 RepID=A0A7S4NP98_GUITH